MFESGMIIKRKVDDVMKIAKSLEETNLSIKGVTIKNEEKEACYWVN